MSTATISRMLDLAVEAERLRTGYDQGERWSYLGGQPKPGADPAATPILPDRECDCSSLCLGLAWLAGYGVNISGTAWTGNAERLLTDAGFSSYDVSGWTLAAIADRMQPGDMVLGPGHIVLVGADRRVLSAETDERGRSAGGQAGDQTGREVYWRQLYARARQWTRLLRSPVNPDAAPAQPPVTAPLATSSGKLATDGVRGPLTIKALQRWVGVTADGKLGPITVRALQAKLGVKTDGILGPITTRALQRLVGASPDGKWGPKTTRALQVYLNALGTAV